MSLDLLPDELLLIIMRRLIVIGGGSFVAFSTTCKGLELLSRKVVKYPEWAQYKPCKLIHRITNTRSYMDRIYNDPVKKIAAARHRFYSGIVIIGDQVKEAMSDFEPSEDDSDFGRLKRDAMLELSLHCAIEFRWLAKVVQQFRSIENVTMGPSCVLLSTLSIPNIEPTRIKQLHISCMNHFTDQHFITLSSMIVAENINLMRPDVKFDFSLEPQDSAITYEALQYYLSFDPHTKYLEAIWCEEDLIFELIRDNQMDHIEMYLWSKPQIRNLDRARITDNLHLYDNPRIYFEIERNRGLCYFKLRRYRQ